MIGRSSRQNKQHRGTLVCTSTVHTEETLESLLKLSNTESMRDASAIVNVMRGRSMTGVTDDSKIMHLFKITWCINFKMLQRILGEKVCLEFENVGYINHGK